MQPTLVRAEEIRNENKELNPIVFPQSLAMYKTYITDVKEAFIMGVPDEFKAKLEKLVQRVYLNYNKNINYEQ
jgi:hypothetical protein